MTISPIEFADRLLAQVDIVDLIGSYMELRPAGSSHKGLCPFHGEKTPSFNVSRTRQIFHCFGCGKGGDAIKFVMEHDGVSWFEALKFVADRYRIPLPEFRKGGQGDAASRDARERILAANKMAADLFAAELGRALANPDSEAAKYFARRGLDAALIQRFGLGLAPDGWTTLVEKGGRGSMSPEFLVGAGLAIRHEQSGRVYDRFRNRIVFSVCDSHGRPVAFGARVFASDARPDEPKYINSPETEVYRKGHQLYALHLARETISREGQALLMEGYMDVIRAHQHGFTGAVASCGTALTDDQARLLKRLCSKVVFVYDGDDAGQNAMLRGIEILLAHEFAIRVVALPGGHDPDSFLANEGTDAFRALVQRAPDMTGYLISVASARHDRASADGKVQVAEFVRPYFNRLANPILRHDLIHRVADFIGVPEDKLERTLVRPDDGRARDTRDELAPDETSAECQLEKRLLRLAVDCPTARGVVLAELAPEWLESPRLRDALALLHILVEEERRVDWPALLNAARTDAEKRFLAEIAFDQAPPQASEAAVLNAIGRIRIHHLKREQARKRRQIEEFLSDSDDNRCADCAHLLAKLDEAAPTLVELGRGFFQGFSRGPDQN